MKTYPTHYPDHLRLDGVRDLGVVLSPDKPGEPLYAWDGGGTREAIVNFRDGKYYLSYDGAMPGGTHESYWNACLAVSDDLKHWEKRGPSLLSSALTHPDSNCTVYPDFCSATSPWTFYDNGRWYRYYVGADHCAEDGTPTFAYTTMLATADRIDGPWHKHCDEPGCAKHLCFPVSPEGAWDDATSSPGQVIINPRWHEGSTDEMKYMMIYSGSCNGVIKRTLGIARTNDLLAADDYDKQTGNFWVKEPEPILPQSHDIENTSLFFEESSGLWWMFTNRVYQNWYADSIWVYWSPDPSHWDPDHRAVVMDCANCTWAHTEIGMPGVVRRDEHTLCMLYDGLPGEGHNNLHRHIALAEISLPLRVK